MEKNKTKNPKNTDSNLFKKLTRLLSGPIINYRTQLPRREKRAQLDKYQSKFKSASGKQFKKSTYDHFKNVSSHFVSNQNRAERYADFEQMEYTPEIASAIDIYADEMTTTTIMGEMLKINCKNEEIKSILQNLYQNVLNVEFNLFGWCRSMCKYGDFLLYLDIDEVIGITNVIGLPLAEIERLEGQDPTNPNYVQYQWNGAGLTLENWQVAHFRILGNDKYTPYGTSVLEAARRIWRQLILLEDAMMAYRIVRSPERRVFYVDVGAIAPQDVEQYMQKVMTSMKRNQIVDPDSGRVDLRYNPLSVDEDYFVPVRGGVDTRIETLAGGTYTGDIDDVKYLRDKLFSALKVPMSYLSRGEGGEEDKTTLAQKDIRFARTITRLQRSVISELEKIGIVHLYTLGYRGDDLVSFSLRLNNPSKISELQDLEHWRTKFDVAAAATEGFFSKRWVATNVLGVSDEEFLRNQREMFYDRVYDASLEEAAAGATGEEAFGGEAGLGGGLGELGGEEEIPAGEEGAEEIPAGEEAELAAPEEDTALLAAPGNRDDNWIKVRKDGTHLTPGAKGKAYKYKGRASKLHHAAPRKKNYKAKYGAYTVKPGKADIYGVSDLLQMQKGLYEDLEHNYDIEEKTLFETGHDIKKLIENLEKNNNEKDKISS